MKSILLAAASLATLAMVPTHAGAVTLFDNLSGTVDGSDPIATNSGSGPLADSFSTGTSAVPFTDLKLLLTSNGASGTIQVNLLKDNGTTPGSQIAALGTIADTSLSLTPTAIDIPVSSINLAANTRYWIQLSSTDSAASWSFSQDNGVGVSNEFFANSAGIFPFADGPYQMQVSAVPLPGAALLFGTVLTGLAGFGATRRRVISQD